MNKILIYLGDSFAKSGITDYEWLVENELIDDQKINFFDFVKSIGLYNNKKKSVFKLAQDIVKKNSWTNRLSGLLGINYFNLSMVGASWQSVFNQILYALLEYKNKEIIFILAAPISERVLIDKIETNVIKKIDLYNLYEIEENFNSSLLLNNHSYHNQKNKINLDTSFLFSEENLKTINSIFTKKIFDLYNIHAIINIINLLKNENIRFFFLPTWYETVKSQIEEIIKDENFLNKFVFSKIEKDQLNFKSPFLLKNFIKNPYSAHPSFHSQELIANYYYDFLRDKI
jgi:hypothetical protein